MDADPAFVRLNENRRARESSGSELESNGATLRIA